MSKKISAELTPEKAVETIIAKAGLSDKRAMFVREYVVDFNGAQAAIRAGYSKKHANTQASRLSTNVNISKCIRDIKRKRYEFLGTGKEDVMAFHSQVLHSPRSTYAESLASAKEIARIEGMYKTNVSLNVTGDLAQRLQAARKRVVK